MAAPVCEVCVDSLGGARAAAAGGADRLELCQALAVGGLTPTPEFLTAVKRAVAIPVFAMVRSRPADFVLDPGELALAVAEARALRAAGADGLVFGAVLPGGAPDLGAVERIVAAAGPLPVTFHRAFDHLHDPAGALDALADVGVARVLTSGGARRAIDAVDALAAIVARAGDRIVVMPGAGVGPEHVVELLARSGAREVHFSASARRRGPMRGLPPAARMGAGGDDDFLRTVTDVERVRATVTAARRGAGQLR